MMNYEMKNFSKISIENDELIIEWEKGIGSVKKMVFALSDIKAIGIDLKFKKDSEAALTRGEDEIR